MSREIKTIGVAKLRGIGDAIIGLGTLAYLRAQHPNFKIIYYVPKWILPLFNHTKGPWDEVVGLDLSSFDGWRKSWSQLQKFKPDVLFEFNQTGRGSKFFKLAMMLRGPYFAHNHHKKSGGIVHDQGVIKSNLQRDLDGAYSFLKELGLSNSKLPSSLQYCPQMGLVTPMAKKNVLLLGVVAQRQTKMWPVSNISEFCKLFLSKFPNWEIWAPVSSNALDQKIKSELHSMGLPSQFKLIEVPLSELPKVIAQTRMYLGNDTGAKHLAVSLGLPTITFFGPEDPMEWHPYDQSKHPFFYRPGLECRTRAAHFCGLAQCSSMICLSEFSAQMAMEKVQNIIIA